MMNLKTMKKYMCPKCGAHQVKQPSHNLIIKVECYMCGYTQLLTNILGPK